MDTLHRNLLLFLCTGCECQLASFKNKIHHLIHSTIAKTMSVQHDVTPGYSLQLYDINAGQMAPKLMLMTYSGFMLKYQVYGKFLGNI